MSAGQIMLIADGIITAVLAASLAATYVRGKWIGARDADAAHGPGRRRH